MKKFFGILFAAAAIVAACDKPGNNGTVPSDPDTVVYGGVTYKTVTLSNGKWLSDRRLSETALALLIRIPLLS